MMKVPYELVFFAPAFAPAFIFGTTATQVIGCGPLSVTIHQETSRESAILPSLKAAALTIDTDFAKVTRTMLAPAAIYLLSRDGLETEMESVGSVQLLRAWNFRPDRSWRASKCLRCFLAHLCKLAQNTL